MIAAKTFSRQTIAVFGLGRSGVTAALSLKAGGATVLAWDDREAARDDCAKQGVPIVDLADANWGSIDSLVLSPGVPHHLPKPHWTAKLAKDAGVPIICDVEIFAREIAARAAHERPKIIAITGTNGKSTTTSLIGHILKTLGKDAQIGGNIGRGVLDLDRMHSGSHYVIELSSYQLERTPSLHANAAVYLNLSPDHLDRHGTLKDYGRAKEAIFANQIKTDTAIIGVDDDNGRAMTTRLKRAKRQTVVPISARRALGSGVFALGGRLMDRTGAKGQMICDLSEAQALEGAHNAQNAAAAYAAVASLGLDRKAIGEAILSFPGLAHRMESLGSVARVRLVNDSKATNAEAARQALSSYKNIYWIAGGVAKAGGIEPLVPLFENVSKAYLIGEAAPAFAKTLGKAKVDYKASGTLRAAVLCAVHDALKAGKDNPVVLLSPACASFDQFENFEVRGDAFRAEAQALIDMFQREAAAMQAQVGQGQDHKAGTAA